MSSNPLIRPVQHGQALLQDIATTQPPPGEVCIWWLGQSGYAIKTASTFFYIDLYLSEHLTAKYAHTEKPHIRMMAAPLRGHEITHAPLLFASHKHSDHLDPGTVPDLMQASPQARLILPQSLIDHAVGMGLDADRLIPVRGEETITLDHLTVHVIPSAHPGLDYDPATGYPFLGFVFEADGVVLYHSGDTLAYTGLADRLKKYAPDIVFLPINGTDERRDSLKVPPNMNMQEAIALAQAVDAKLMIPHHYDMFTFNTADVADFRTAAEQVGLPYQVLHCGEKFCYTASA